MYSSSELSEARTNTPPALSLLNDGEYPMVESVIAFGLPSKAVPSCRSAMSSSVVIVPFFQSVNNVLTAASNVPVSSIGCCWLSAPAKTNLSPSFVLRRSVMKSDKLPACAITASKSASSSAEVLPTTISSISGVAGSS